MQLLEVLSRQAVPYYELMISTYIANYFSLGLSYWNPNYELIRDKFVCSVLEINRELRITHNQSGPGLLLA